MNLRNVAGLAFLSAAICLAGCSAYAYDDDRPAGLYGYYEPHYYYDRSPRYYHGAYYDRRYVHVDRNDFNRGRGEIERGRPTPVRGEPARPVFDGNDHHESTHIDGGVRGEDGRPGGLR